MGHYKALGSKSFLHLDFDLLTWPLLYYNKLPNWMDRLLQSNVWASQSHREDSKLHSFCILRVDVTGNQI